LSTSVAGGVRSQISATRWQQVFLARLQLQVVGATLTEWFLGGGRGKAVQEESFAYRST